MRLSVFGLLALISGCDAGSESAGSVPTSESIELRNRLPADALPVGVTIAPDGRRYVLDQRSGLYDIGDSSTTLVWNTTGLTGLELTDVVALGAQSFAVTAENDGFLLDIGQNTFTSYFCYLPSIPSEPLTEPPMSVSQALQIQGIPVKQRTDSVAFNRDTFQLFAQPQTIRLDDSTVAGSELFVFGQAGGEPIQVFPLAEPSFVAGGMVAASGGRLILGARNRIYELTLDGAFTELGELDASIDITGMAGDPNGDLWILDGAARRLVKIQGGL